MHKILTLLGVTLLSSSLLPKVVNLNVIENKIQNDNFRLNLAPINQEQNNYCLAASIQSIFNYMGMEIATQYTQNQIFSDLGGEEPEGLDFSEETASYLENNINSRTNHRVQYQFNELGSNFGRSREDIVRFQNYIRQSLEHNQPVLLAYEHARENFDHVFVIIGVEVVDWAPWLTQYTYMEPTGGVVRTFFARDLLRYTLSWSALVGYGNFPDSGKKDEINIAIDNHEVGEDKLNDEYDHEVVRVRTDVTATMGINKTGEMNDSIKKITLNKFNGEIYNFTWKKKVNNFDFDVRNLPDNNDFWKSPRVEIASSSEDVGSAHIQGKISAQIEFERTKSLNHLLMYLIIYVSGQSWSTRNWAHVWFQTGDILGFIKK